jgi:N-acetylglutamate synthase-like GNAT family acetyltransferase
MTRNSARSMDVATITAQVVRPNQLHTLRAAVRKARLPVEDISNPAVTLFAFRSDKAFVGCGGLEIYGADALLRSVFVDPNHRNRGIGRHIVEFLLDHAASEKVSRVYLLTTGAHAYFAKAAFTAIDRRAAPASIAATRQMASLCPASSVLMVREQEPSLPDRGAASSHPSRQPIVNYRKRD